jgi:hypothetical protein
MEAWFDDDPVLGRLPLHLAAEKLSELGDDLSAGMLKAASQPEVPNSAVIRGVGSIWPFQNRPWQGTNHAFGFLEIHELDKCPLAPIRDAGSIKPDLTLRAQRIKITLSGMRAAEYPGSGLRRVLLDFYARNQEARRSEDLHFNATFRIGQRGDVAALGYPLFIGLRVGDDGVLFKCFTVNVGNERDDALLHFLEGDIFRAGLKLTSSLQPALAPFSAMAFNLTRAVARRRRNVPVQEFYLGLDFSTAGVGARLAEGTYIAVQLSAPASVLWNWDMWAFDRMNGRIVGYSDHSLTIPHNYIMFTVTRYGGD